MTDESLTKKLASLPALPGVYLMKDAAGEIIYIGKAIDLRARVKTYFGRGDGRVQVEFLVKRVADLDTIVTENEDQAFILERDLINRYKPRYNIQLKDDKSYLSVRIDKAAQWPRLQLVRRVEQDGALYFGPYSSTFELRLLLDIIRAAIPLRTCPDTVLRNRQRPCLEYQIKRCAGPCCLPVDPDKYRQWVQQAIAILEGRTSELVDDLSALMHQAAEELRFEEAAALRDRVSILEQMQDGPRQLGHRGESRDTFSLHREGERAALVVFIVRNGRLTDSASFYFTNVVVPDEELLESAVGQFYEQRADVPEEIVVPIELINLAMIRQALRRKRGAAVEIVVPRAGSKLRLLRLALLNARQSFATRFEAEDRYPVVAQELAVRLKLRQAPRRIECVDISNLQGSDVVGAIVCFFDGLADKKAYRHYNISDQRQDDFAAVNEVVSRRLKRGVEEGDMPDLLIIDGGGGQLSAAIAAREAARVSVDIVALAKMRRQTSGAGAAATIKPERVYIDGVSEPLVFRGDDPVTHFLQRIRDEVHRFVLAHHRRRRGKRIFKSALDEIAGLGPERKARLLKAYGSVSKIGVVPPEELAKTGRMPLSLANKVIQKLSSKSS